jgi:hypothetical protein
MSTLALAGLSFLSIILHYSGSHRASRRDPVAVDTVITVKRIFFGLSCFG